MIKLRIRIHFHHPAAPRLTLALALLALLLLAAPALSLGRAGASSAPDSTDEIPGVREYYLADVAVPGSGAIGSCAAGFHFASIWEIADPSSLRYNIHLGITSPDSGKGPPTAKPSAGSPVPLIGWVRTGYDSSASESAGHGNCYAWVTPDSIYWGTAASLPESWTAGEQDLGVWKIDVLTCNSLQPVWCVQDDTVFHSYLPLVDK